MVCVRNHLEDDSGKCDVEVGKYECASTFLTNTKGHWKRSCPKYLKDLKDGKVEKGVHSGMYMIELHNTTTSDSWVLDTGCGTHIYAVLYGLKESRRLKHRELNLIMGNRKITLVLRIGKFELMLKSGVRINLNNSSPCKGIYETVECISNDGNMILNVGSSNELDKSKLWHSRLGHVNKKRITQLQKDGVLESLTLNQMMYLESLACMRKFTTVGFLEAMYESVYMSKVSGIKYLDKILKRLRMKNSKKGNLPLHHGIKISKDLCPKTDDELDKMSRVLYASAIGSIMYAMTCTRPDVSFALSMVSLHQQNPGEGHWTAVKNILRYLRNTKDRFLVYGGEKELRVTGYYDAGWQTDKDDSRSQSGWVFLLNGGAVTWKSSKQDTVADSTCESEYIAACEASKEAIWMKNFIGDLGVVPTVQDPIEILCDNESAVALTKEPKDHGKGYSKLPEDVVAGVLKAGRKLPMTSYPKEFANVEMMDMRMRPCPSSGYPGRTYRFYNEKTEEWIMQKRQKTKQNDKLSHGNGEKTVQNQGQSPKMPKSRVNTEEISIKRVAEQKNTIECNLYHLMGR
ncbi:retrotransposon protein, putative, ty1-copia subclass [Tanacetum coccineum]|uniref:Retrotransposon protein, putative, ty1-copia subclass n=1 Tax=Tanacetum coccineum TaxID=301880 RepID=A0ABQ5IIG1_9ASTR